MDRSPSYLRATASSARRASLNQPMSKDAKASANPQTVQVKPVPQFYQGPLISIKPVDHTKPCPLASLPSELRCLIYDYALDDYKTISLSSPRYHSSFKYNHLLWPALLRVSRAVRTEAAYMFYSRIAFTATIKKLDFSTVTTWIKKIQFNLRGYLSRNTNLRLTLELFPSYYGDDYLEIGHGFSSATVWTYCHQFGPVFNIRRDKHKKHFIYFCRLAEWWLWCSKPIYEDIQWHYDMQLTDEGYGEFNGLPDALWRFLRDCLSAVALPCVQKHWVRTRQEAKMKKHVLNMLNECDQSCARIKQARHRDFRRWDDKRWENRMAATKNFVQRWPESSS